MRLRISGRQIMSKRLYAVWFLPFVLFLFAFQWLPLLWILRDSIRNEDGDYTISNFTTTLTDPYYLQALRNAVEISLYSAVIGLVISVIISHAMSRSKATSGRLVSFLNMIANFSGVPLAFAFVIILGLNGIFTVLLKNAGLGEFELYSKLGLTLVYIYFQIPLGVLLLYPAFDALKHEWQEAAALLGANIVV